MDGIGHRVAVVVGARREERRGARRDQSVGEEASVLVPAAFHASGVRSA